MKKRNNTICISKSFFILKMSFLFVILEAIITLQERESSSTSSEENSSEHSSSHSVNARFGFNRKALSVFEKSGGITSAFKQFVISFLLLQIIHFHQESTLLSP